MTSRCIAPTSLSIYIHRCAGTMLPPSADQAEVWGWLQLPMPVCRRDARVFRVSDGFVMGDYYTAETLS